MIHRSHSLTSDRSNINKISRRNIGGLEDRTAYAVVPIGALVVSLPRVINMFA
jgi:hypothetical protein